MLFGEPGVSWVTDLKFDYGDFKIDVPRWEILDSGVTALWGPSGSGKTSVFRFLIGLESSPGMSWIYKDVDLAKLPTPKRRLGVVFQNYELFPHMTARENLVFAADARGIQKDAANATIEEYVKTLRLETILDRSVMVLSGGERQRVALARALVGQPRVLLLDEPFSSLDVDLRKEARELVKHAIAKAAIPTILITHDRDDLSVLAAKITEIKQGKIAPEN